MTNKGMYKGQEVIIVDEFESFDGKQRMMIRIVGATKNANRRVLASAVTKI